jgi:O-antigen ligase
MGLVPPRDIIASFVVFYVGFSLLPIAFAQSHYFHVSLVYPFFVYLALLWWAEVSSVDPALVAKRCLGVVVFGSLLAATVAPGFATESNYSGLLPEFTLRVWGVTGHPNTLGSAACALIVLESAERSAKAWRHIGIQWGAGLALVLSQSKTAMAATFLGLSVIATYRFLAWMRAGPVARGRMPALPLSAIAVLVVALLATGSWAVMSDSSGLIPTEPPLDTRAISELSTATGRTNIWAAAIDAGLRNPLFGQGADFWSERNQARLGLFGAVHAHNLFLEVFSRSGFVGLGSLLVFLGFLVTYSVRAAGRSRGGSLGLMSVFLLRAIFEVPIQPNVILGAEFLAMMAYLCYVLDRGAKRLVSADQPPTALPLWWSRKNPQIAFGPSHSPIANLTRDSVFVDWHRP